jgi:hypothetical protein
LWQTLLAGAAEEVVGMGEHAARWA